MLDGPESLVRVGIAKKTELRLTVPDYSYNLSAGGSPGSGFGDFAVGLKQQLGPTMGQLKQCPEAFKVGEILGKAFDSLKYAQDGSEIGERYLPPAGTVIPPLV